MKNFILDTNPKFGEAKVTLNKTDYHLKSIKGNGCVFAVFQDGVERDEVIFSPQDLKALYLLLSTEK